MSASGSHLELIGSQVNISFEHTTYHAPCTLVGRGFDNKMHLLIHSVESKTGKYVLEGRSTPSRKRGRPRNVQYTMRWRGESIMLEGKALEDPMLRNTKLFHKRFRGSFFFPGRSYCTRGRRAAICLQKLT